MASPRHILIVNSRSVHQPVFVVGAPHSGADLIGRALKASPGFHVTIGQPSVLRTVYAFARRPSMHQGRPQAAAAVIRDAFAQGWQVTAHGCLECSRECRAAAGLPAGRCALRWRWSVRLAARLHHSLPAGQLKTIRYEDLMSRPDDALAGLSRFTGTTVSAAPVRGEARTSRHRARSRRPTGAAFSAEDTAQLAKLAGEELRRLGY